MRNKENEYYSPLPKVMVATMISGIVVCLVFALLYQAADQRWMLSCAITFGVIAYHMVIRFLESFTFATEDNEVDFRWALKRTSKLDEYSRRAKELYGNTPEYKEMEEKQKNRSEEEFIRTSHGITGDYMF